jgi:hypothetical protein
LLFGAIGQRQGHPAVADPFRFDCDLAVAHGIEQVYRRKLLVDCLRRTIGPFSRSLFGFIALCSRRHHDNHRANRQQQRQSVNRATHRG